MAMRSINFNNKKEVDKWILDLEEQSRKREIGSWVTNQRPPLEKIRERLEARPNPAAGTRNWATVDTEWVERVFRPSEQTEDHMKNAMIKPLHFNVVLSEMRTNMDAVAMGNTSLALSNLLAKLCLVSSGEDEADKEGAWSL